VPSRSRSSQVDNGLAAKPTHATFSPCFATNRALTLGSVRNSQRIRHVQITSSITTSLDCFDSSNVTYCCTTGFPRSTRPREAAAALVDHHRRRVASFR
jgi:hypothetical protein